ncbi:MAG: hypothetical protein WAW80_00930 [Candidatus Saccharimonadales bacterium]
MRKTINIFTLIFFILLVSNTLDISNVLLKFLLVGELPGTNTILSPSMMLAIITTISGIIIIKFLTRRVEIIRKESRLVNTIIARQERLPNRRFTRI